MPDPRREYTPTLHQADACACPCFKELAADSGGIPVSVQSTTSRQAHSYPRESTYVFADHRRVQVRILSARGSYICRHVVNSEPQDVRAQTWVEDRSRTLPGPHACCWTRSLHRPARCTSGGDSLRSADAGIAARADGRIYLQEAADGNHSMAMAFAPLPHDLATPPFLPRFLCLTPPRPAASSASGTDQVLRWGTVSARSAPEVLE